MIESRELRIGNIVGYDGLWYVVSSIIEPKEAEPTHRVGFENSTLRKLTRDIQPVPLIEEWVKTLGFDHWGTEVKNEYETHEIWFIGDHRHDGCCIHFVTSTYGGVKEKTIEFYKGYDYITEVESMHELQNAYFVVAKSELAIKTPEHA